MTLLALSIVAGVLVWVAYRRGYASGYAAAEMHSLRDIARFRFYRGKGKR